MGWDNASRVEHARESNTKMSQNEPNETGIILSSHWNREKVHSLCVKRNPLSAHDSEFAVLLVQSVCWISTFRCSSKCDQLTGAVLGAMVALWSC